MPGSGYGRLIRPPVADDPVADGGDGPEGRVGGVQQLLGGREVLALGPEGLGGLGLLVGREGLADAQPGERHAGGGHRGLEPSGGRSRRFARRVRSG